MYQISIDKKAAKELVRLPKKEYQKITETIYLLSNNPLPHGYKELKGYPNHYRIRQGNYRVIYLVHHSSKTITIIKIGNRKDVYSSF